MLCTPTSSPQMTRMFGFFCCADATSPALTRPSRASTAITSGPIRGLNMIYGPFLAGVSKHYDEHTWGEM